ncbi:MAG: phenylpropionate dioxygenase-like ring-hydroxylating dioxygenase large terminal subunit [Lysobacterales bacterium]|jgi:phenylpropionate dioxygenase-like ring-hydroxylating dioxygenase large terminal subunit
MATESVGGNSSMKESKLNELIARQKERHGLEQVFYSDPDIYAKEIEQIYLRAWLYAGHQSEISNPGDWFLFEFANESVIIVRSDENTITALVNVCRHRGSRVRTEKNGCSKRLTCPYHGWTYALDGSLLVAAYMNEDFDKSAHSLRTIHCEILDGLIMVNFSDDPAPFSHFQDQLGEFIAPYDLASAKVAHRESYPVKANWKLAVENYSECYHCATAHKEYSKGHSLSRPWTQSVDLLNAVTAKRPACGLPTNTISNLHLDAPAFGVDASYEFHPMWKGHLTGSENGQAIAPFLGSISDYDGSATDMQLGPVCFSLLYCDHVLIYRFTPVSIDHTECDVTWLVRGDAEEGKDYDKDKLTWMWDVTTAADKRIIENNARGVASSFYQPGPLSNMENYLSRFIDWYLKTLRQDLPIEANETNKEASA